MSVIISIIIIILIFVAQWKIFTKAGKPGWHCIVPYLNAWDLCCIAWSRKMAGIFVGSTVVYSILSAISSGKAANGESSGALGLILGIVSVFYLVLYAMLLYKLSKSFGHGVGFTIGLIFLAPIFMCILGYGSSQYIGPEGNGMAASNNAAGGNPFDNNNPYA